MSKTYTEKYGIDENDVEIDGEESLCPDAELQGTYSLEKVDIDVRYFSIYELKRKYDRTEKQRQNKDNYSKIDIKNQIILDSEFQRENVWDRKQKSELIESVLMGLPIPAMYLFADRYANLIVVDGRQRLTAFFQFMDNKFALSNLKILKGLSKKKFDDLDPVYQSKIEDYQLITQIIKPTTPDSIKFNIFDRVNRGGTTLNNQEMRNALYQGNSTNLLNKLSKSDAFKRATNNSIKEKRMKDKYLILRAIAFYLLMNGMIVDRKGNAVGYNGDIDEFLGKTMDYLNFVESDVLNMLEYKFLFSMDRIHQILGEDAFRLKSNNNKRSPINMNVFEVVAYVMMQVADLSVKDDNFIRSKYIELITDNGFLENIRNHRDSESKVKIRFDGFAKDFIKEIKND